MGIETPFSGKYIDDLNADWPLGTDSKDDGDGHLRGIKLVLQNTFTGLTGAVTATQAELNILDGVTATAAELNYNDITTLGPAEASKVITADASANVDASALTFTDLGAVTTVDINGGTVDGAVIGGSSAAAITGTTVNAGTSLTVNGSTAITGIENTVVGSATKLVRADGIAAAITAASPVYTGTSSNGSLTLGSLILKFGYTTTSGEVNITFATPFPNACFNVSVTDQEASISGGSGSAASVEGTPDVNGFRISKSAAHAYWMAIGN